MPDLALYEAFEKQVFVGLRKEAARTMLLFIQSFSGLEDRKQWTEAFLEDWKDSHKFTIRHELYEHVVFPVLLESFKKSEPWGIRWLARTVQNLYKATALWEQVDCMTEGQLLEQLLSITPHDTDLQDRILAIRIDSLRHCVHEWPRGILYGMNGATLEQCAEIEQAAAEARIRDLKGDYSEFVTDFEDKLREYVRRMEAYERKRASEGSA